MISTHATDSIYEIPLKDIHGNATTLLPYKGKVLLIVNVASKCGFTSQYTALESLYQKYKDRGLVVLGFPCNQFAGQEPGTSEEITAFCTSKYQVTFPIFEKIEVNGTGRHRLYEYLAGKDSPQSGFIKWNFTKFLVSRDGKILDRYAPITKPDSENVMKAIESAL